MDLEIIILSEVKSDREGQIHAIVYVWNFKKKEKSATELICKTESLM